MDHIHRYLTWVRASAASPHTLRLRRYYLSRLADHYPGRDLLTLTVSDLAEFLGCYDWMPETRRAARSSIRSFYGWAVDTDQITSDPSRKLPPVRVPRAEPRPTPETVFANALGRASQRDRLMIMLAGFMGLRREEISRVHTRDMLGDELRVRGKGGRIRTLPLHPAIAAEIRSLPAGYVFPGKHRGHLAPNYVGIIMKRLLGPGWSAHTLRHRFASKAFEAERDIRAVQALLGHAKLESTQIYTKIPDQALRRAVDCAAIIRAS